MRAFGQVTIHKGTANSAVIVAMESLSRVDQELEALIGLALVEGGEGCGIIYPRRLIRTNGRLRVTVEFRARQ